MIFTAKQNEYIREANAHRWGIKAGAVRSGKSFVDVAHSIPHGIRSRAGLPGLVVILGNTRGTLQRNIIAPMQELFGRSVSDIRADNTADIFGERCYCLGADNIRHIDRIRGASIKYAYGDEITTYNKGVFDMLKSRLDKPYSRFDGTCNPDAPGHWVKEFLDSNADIYRQQYSIDDNPFLPRSFVEALKKEYADSVYYDRYILGLWVAAEGAIYRLFADNPHRFITESSSDIVFATVGVDFGGHDSAHSFTLTGFSPAFKRVTVLDEWYYKGELTPQELEAAFVRFISENARKYPIYDAYCDSAETTLIKGIEEAARIHRLNISVCKSRKLPINDRIKTEIRLMAADRFRVMAHCKHLIEALSAATWDSKATKDTRLDDGSYPVDPLDSFEYSFEREITSLIEGGNFV